MPIWLVILVTSGDPKRPDVSELDKLARYLAGYCCKEGDSISDTLGMYGSIAASCEDTMRTKDFISKLLVRSIGLRKMSAPECSLDNIGGHLYRHPNAKFLNLPLTAGRMVDSAKVKKAREQRAADVARA